MSSVKFTRPNFGTVGEKIEKQVDLVIRKGVAEVQRNAVMEVVQNAFDTGNLAASIQQAKIGQLHYEVYTVVDYAGYVHDGTERMGARPFFVWATSPVFPKVERAIAIVTRSAS